MEKTFETDKISRQSVGRPYGGVAPEARAAERRDALIRAGTRVFGTVGFRKATVRAICQDDWDRKGNGLAIAHAGDGNLSALVRTLRQVAADEYLLCARR